MAVAVSQNRQSPLTMPPPLPPPAPLPGPGAPLPQPSGFSAIDSPFDTAPMPGPEGTSGSGFTNATSPVTGGFPGPGSMTPTSEAVMTGFNVLSTLAGAGIPANPLGFLGLASAGNRAGGRGLQTSDMN